MDKETSEIAKLTERISKDPKSKLFVPLAEEYKKTGEIEMAIHVLTEGLKNNPGYVTARSVLGKLLLEKGDLDASQKEFEEVVKTIPDNLMAQRKLGELYALQNRPEESIKHFRIVLSANPRDAELASLVSDLEAGRDVRSRIHQPKPQPSPEKSVSQGAQAAPLPQTPTPAIPARAAAAPAVAVRQGTSAKEAQTPERGPSAMSGRKAPSAAASVSGPPPMEVEEPEDIMAVEPLEPVSLAPETPRPAPDFLAEQDHEPATASVEEPPAETVPARSGEQGREAAAVVESVFAETAPLGEWEAKEPQPDLSDVPIEADIIGAEVVEEAPGPAVAAKASDEVPEKSDDFTTDTLAELYIAQGFYEKAIDIYERMLADRPTSRGLKDKLERVRAMALESGSAAPAASVEEPAKSAITEADVFAEQIDFAPPVETEDSVFKTEAFAEPRQPRSGKEAAGKRTEENIFGEAGEEGPAVGPGDEPAAGRAPALNAFAPSPSREPSQGKPLFTDFEPREYVPPKDVFEPVEHKAEANQAASRPSTAANRETIVRLESWLKNIKKEK